MSPELKRTPLYNVELAAGARFVEFAGWLMPVQYTGILEEHRSVRQSAGLFDLYHMGEIELSGPRALDFVQRMLTNDAARLSVGQAQYTLLCNERGGVIDDLLVYRLEDSYLLVVNASNTARDLDWLLQHRIDGCSIVDASVQTGLLALQGPLSPALLQGLTDVDLNSVPHFRSRRGLVAGVPALVSRTGYTGEDGFELFCDWTNMPQLWKALTSLENSPRPCGLGARDTLRLEAALALHGHELDENINPFEAGLGWVVKLDKAEFVGRAALLKAKAAGPRRRLVGLEITDRAIARNGFPILKDGQAVGHITSGTFAPTLEKSIALGYVPTEMAQVGAEFQVEVRGRPIGARVVPIPFYKRRL